MGADGQPVAGAIQAGSSVMILNETQLRTGFNQRTDDSRSYAGGLRMESSAAAFTDQQMGEILVDAIGDDLAHGSIREQDRQALADSYAQYLAASGVTAGVSNSENVQYQGGVNGTLGLSEAGSGFGIGGSVVKSKTDGRDVRIDLDRKQLNAFIDEALEQTRGDYGDARLVFTNHYEFGARWNQHIREKVEDYRDTNLNISKDAVEGHNAVEEPSTPPAPRPITQYRW